MRVLPEFESLPLRQLLFKKPWFSKAFLLFHSSHIPLPVCRTLGEEFDHKQKAGARTPVSLANERRGGVANLCLSANCCSKSLGFPRLFCCFTLATFPPTSLPNSGRRVRPQAKGGRQFTKKLPCMNRKEVFLLIFRIVSFF